MRWMRSGGVAIVLMLLGAGLLPTARVLAVESRALAADEAPRRFSPAPRDVTDGSEAPAAPYSERDGRTDRLIVKYKDRALGQAKTFGSERVQALRARGGVALSHLRPMSGNGQVFKMPQRMNLDEAQAIADKLAQDPEVEYAVPDRMLYPMLTPNDTSYPSQWDFKSPADNEIAGSNLPAAWDLSTGSASVVIGVVDTGIVNHADLQGRILPGYNFISDPVMAGNGIGRSADASDLGDWTTNSDGSIKSASSWHGTHVAGTIAATSNNGAGVAGINWNSKILPVRVLGHGGGYWSDIGDGMRWAAGLSVPGVPDNPNPARVLNLSLGGPGACDVETQGTIDDVVSAGVVVVVAAGNSSVDVSTAMPANCNGVITVAAIERSGGKSYYSNYGTQVEIAAPGDLILSTLNSGSTTPIASPAGDRYAQYSGTSMATPHVAGVASLLLSVAPALNPSQVLATLQASARPFPTGTATSDCTTSKCGAGILDAYQAVLSQVTAQPVAAATPSALSFDKTKGEPETAGQNIIIDIYNGSNLTWTASSSASWLRVTPSAGANGATLTVTVDIGALPAAYYSGSITVSVDGAINSPLTIPVNLTVRQVLDLKAQIPSAVTSHALAAVGQKIYVIGGSPSGSLVQIYDTITNSWSTGAAKPTPAFGINAAVIDGKIYVPGGKNYSTVSSALEIYDPAINQWTSGASLPEPRYASGVEALDGKLYVMGGYDQTKSSPATYAYDPASNSWSRKADMFAYTGRPYMGTAVANGKIYSFGGWDGLQASNMAMSYDPATDIWWYRKDMNRGRMKFATAGVAGKIYAFGGSNSNYSVEKLSDAVLYDPATNSWSDVPLILSQARDEVKAVAIGNTVYVMGGKYKVTTPNPREETSAVNESYTMALPVNGACGSAHGKAYASAPTSNLCASGVPGPVTGAGSWQWSCAGVNGGTTASCSAATTTPLIITNDAQQQGFVGIHYSLDPGASGGLPPYQWTLSGGPLPQGFYYDPVGPKMYGVTWAPGNFSFTLYVTDAAGTMSSRLFSLSIASPPAMVPRSPGFYFGTIERAYVFAADGETIRLSGGFEFKEDVTLNRDLKVTLDGGYSDDLTTRSGKSRIRGKLSVTSGTVKLNGITFQ